MKPLTKAILAGANCKGNKLTIRNEICHLDTIRLSNVEISEVVRKGMANTLSQELLRNNFTMTVTEHPGEYTRVYEMFLWSFSEERLDDLLEYAYQLGLDGREL